MVALRNISSGSSSVVGLSLAVLFLFSATPSTRGQSTSVCEGELGQAGWTCDALTPIPPQVFDGVEEFLPLPGDDVDPENPVSYKQIAGKQAFDAVSGERNDNTAVFVLTEGTYFCMVVESDGEAALFDAPEGERNV